jgi:Rrf2 family protein
MKITALEEYGLRCLLHVARQSDDDPISAQQVAEREGLSLPYTQKILRILAQGELIEARRGVNGGYVLARPVERISVGDALRVLGGMFDIDEICERYTGELKACTNSCTCTIKPLWSHISEFVVRTLDNISIKVLLQDHEAVAGYLEKLAPKPNQKFCPVGV